MLRHTGWLLLLVALVGCGQGSRIEPPTAKGPGEELPRGTGFEGGNLEPSLSELLRKPRLELAALCDETLETIRARQQARENKSASVGPLGAMRPPLIVPVFREATWSSEAGMSLPPYLKAGSHDTAVALHLARHGDVEVARKLIDPADREALTRIDTLALEPNVPLEWTRLVGLRQHAALLRLALNDPEGATDLVTLHRQLRATLGPKAAQGPLGAALLGNGRRALQLAATAWQERKRSDLAGQAENVLNSWSEVPLPEPGLSSGMSWAEALLTLQTTAEGRMARAEVLRSLDLLALPLPEAGAQAVFAFRDGDRLGEVLVLYRTVGHKAYRDPGHLAWGLEDLVTGVGDESKQPGLPRRTFTLGTTVCEVALTPRTGLLSGFVRVNAGKALSVPPLPRDYGVVHLDRSFEQNRLQVAPSLQGDRVRTVQAGILERIQNPLQPARVEKLELRREPGHRATEGLLLTYEPADAAPPLAELARPAWIAWGAGRFEPGEDEQGGFLGLSWADARTRIVLRLPHTQTEPLTVRLQDTRPSTVRDPAADVFDREQRKARIAAGNPHVRLPRTLEPIGVQLGMSREQARGSLPSGRGVYTRDTPDGLVTTLTGEPLRDATSVPRQVFVRFDRNSKVAEVRVRFENAGQDSPEPGVRGLLHRLERHGGTGVEASAAWARLWPDRRPTMRTWRDDLTRVTYQEDAAGAEVSLCHCPVDHADGETDLPLEYLPRGPESCLLGDSRESLLRQWKVKEPVTTADGALVLYPARGSLHDVVLVYFSGDKAERILARHAQEKPLSTQPQVLASAVANAWGRELRTLGWPRRQDRGIGNTVQALAFHDEQTLVKLFWQDDSQGKPAVFTEWREMPR